MALAHEIFDPDGDLVLIFSVIPGESEMMEKSVH